MNETSQPPGEPHAAGEAADSAEETADPALVSVIIPARNASGALNLCLDSVAASDYPNVETIVVSDASTDETVKVARRHGVRVMTNDKPCGAAYARNVGASVARGDILFFAG